METKTIDKKLLDFQMKVEKIKKDGKNEFFKKPGGKASSYATLPNILENVKPLLNQFGILVTQPIINGEVLTVLTCTETNEKKSSGITLTPGLNAQQTGSAITYFRRYTLVSLLALEIDEDDDGNAASGNTTQPTKSQATKAEKPYLNENSEAFTKAVDYIKGGGTINEIEKKYKLSEAVKKALVDAAI